MRFSFETVNAAGVRERGEVEAADERAALRVLAMRGQTALLLQPVAIKAQRVSRRLTASDRALAVRQLAGLIEGGVTLPNALGSVAASSTVATVRDELRDVHAALSAGEPMPAAFARATKLLPAVERQVVVAGAEAGDLARVLARLADYLEERDALRGRLIGALVYPAVVGIVALGVIVALLVFVMPQIVAAFAQTRQQLPWLTQSLLTLSAALRQFGVPLAMVLLVIVFGGLWLLRGPLRERGLALLLRLPLVGPLARSADEVRVLTTLAMLVESAVPLPRAMTAAAHTARFGEHAARIDAAQTLLTQGSPVTQAFADTRALDRMSLELLRHGETVGGVAAAFSKAANLKRQALERRLHWFATLVEPLMILLLGGVVLLLVLAVMLPIVTLNSAVR
ncbi:MAG: type II secretion system F family protein [Burkholderiales bacterium]|nr:type II secretion system F family protein [Burkholderiales bacterium]